MPIKLACTESGSGPPMTILHGLFGSARNWAKMARRFAADRRVLAFDLRNHGASPWVPEMDYESMAGDVAHALDTRRLSSVDLLGHSMGGKVAMWLALSRPDLVHRLVVVDIAPITYEHAFAAPYAEAMRAIDLSQHTSRRSVDEALSQSLPDAVLRAFLMSNLARGGDGFRWCVNLEAFSHNMDRLRDFPETDARFAGPALFIGGGTYYLQATHEAAARRLFPNARFMWIDGAGHWVHHAAPEAFADAVAGFLDIDLAGMSHH